MLPAGRASGIEKFKENRHRTSIAGLLWRTIVNLTSFLRTSAVALLVVLGVSARAETSDPCKEPREGSKDAPILSPPLAEMVTGNGRLQFYSAPDERCVMTGVFVIPKDELVAYVQTDSGWTSVVYNNPRTGNSVSGWVRSDRLKSMGTVGPRQ